MEEVSSKVNDCKWLANRLKIQMGKYVSFNQYGMDKQTLIGTYNKRGTEGPSWFNTGTTVFYIKFCKGDFLRIQIEIGSDSNDISNAMIELTKALAPIIQDGKPIGFPLAIYRVGDLLTCEYSFKNPELIISALKDNTMFDDVSIENLNFVNTCKDCDYGSYTIEESGNAALYCTNNCSRKTQEDNTCIDHKFLDGRRPNINLLCYSICDNN